MLGCSNYSCMNFSFWKTGNNPGKIYNKLGRRMSYDSHVGINSFGFFFTELNIYLLPLRLISLSHVY